LRDLLFLKFYENEDFICLGEEKELLSQCLFKGYLFLEKWEEIIKQITEKKKSYRGRIGKPRSDKRPNV
jgi:hypothetical protein